MSRESQAVADYGQLISARQADGGAGPPVPAGQDEFARPAGYSHDAKACERVDRFVREFVDGGGSAVPAHQVQDFDRPGLRQYMRVSFMSALLAATDDAQRGERRLQYVRVRYRARGCAAFCGSSDGAARACATAHACAIAAA